ncbi:MAG: pilus assembly protein TadG-related protein [Candidatus Sumerlaeia bacterium]|nr:pilus assembly protein TadG-related protein [Candidatus Sumerlaeia bacterium]
MSRRQSTILIARSAPRQGSILLLFVVLIPILFAMLALMIDLGMIRGVQARLQSAADHGAITGLRERDSGNDQREAVRTAVRQVFDDDLSLAVDPTNVSAGPEISFTPGVGPNFAGQSIITPISFYDPDLARNDGTQDGVTPTGDPPNLPHGDMLSGTYIASASHEEGVNFPNPYLRDDFLPNLAAVPDAPSFLVRVRRVTDFLGLGFENEPFISTSAPGLPMLFGRATTAWNDGGSPYQPRVHGLSVRATAIADEQPAISAGPYIPSALANGGPAVTGTAPFSIRVGWWNSVAVGVPQTLYVRTTGSVTTGAPPGAAGTTAAFLSRRGESTVAAGAGDGTLTVSSTAFVLPVPPAGRVVRVNDELMRVTGVLAGPPRLVVTRGVNGTAAAAHGIGSLVTTHEPVVIGDEVVTAALTPGYLALDPGEQYFPLFIQTAATLNIPRVVAFGYASVSVVGPGPAGSTEVTITRLGPGMGAENVSAVPVRALDLSLSTAEVDAVFAARSAPGGGIAAPALVRSVGR